jgi:hypothetical protein
MGEGEGLSFVSFDFDAVAEAAEKMTCEGDDKGCVV